MMNVTLHDGDKFWYLLPRNETMSMSLLGYVKANMGFTTSCRFIDEGMERAQITLFFADHTSENLLRIREAAYDYFKDRPMKIGKGEFKLAGGRIGLEIALNEEMKKSHAIIDLTVLGAIFILCTLSFMSVTAESPPDHCVAQGGRRAVARRTGTTERGPGSWQVATKVGQ